MKPHVALLYFLAGACGGAVGQYEMEPVDPARYQGPTVAAVDPPPGSYGVPWDYPVRITFTERLRPETVTTAVGAVGRGGVFFPFQVFPAHDGRSIRVVADWPSTTPIRVSVGATLLDEGGYPLRDQDRFNNSPDTPYTLHFTTGTARLHDPPTLTATLPADGETHVTPLTDILLRFSKRMAPELPEVSVRSAHGEATYAARWENDRTELRITPTSPLLFGSVYTVEVSQARGAWGLELSAAKENATKFRFVTMEQEGKILINEVVTNPQHDWNNSSGGSGIPFDPYYGDGSITLSDEYVEIFNGSSRSIDLRGWSLEMIDGTDEYHFFGERPHTTERFTPESATLGDFKSGAYLVVGNPPGSMRNDVLLILRDAYGFERDRVQLGQGYAPGGQASGPEDEAVARIPNGRDTGDNAQDWQKAPATPGLPNEG